MTDKIVDNTFISACISEINCIDLLDICASNYNLITTEEVYGETKKGFDLNIVSKAYNHIKVIKKDSVEYIDLKEWLQNRYPELHDGEISAFLFALLNFDIPESEYYYVTDDGYMKSVIKNLHEDTIFLKKLGHAVNFENFKVTGTIGFTRRLIEKGIISPNFIEPILSDMDNNGFYLSKEIKDHLRGL